MKKLFAVLLTLVLTVSALAMPAMAATKVKTVVTLSHSGTVTLNVGDTLQLSATVIPEAAVKWKTSKAKVATVDGNGLVQAMAEGTATIKARAEKPSPSRSRWSTRTSPKRCPSPRARVSPSTSASRCS